MQTSKLEAGIYEMPTGWVLEILTDGKYELRNPGPNGEKKFFTIVHGQHSPMIVEDPDKAYPAPSTCQYVDGKGSAVTPPTFPIKGIIVKEAPGLNGNILYRGNLTNALSKDNGRLLNNGAIFEKDGVQYHLYAMVQENKNRIVGAIGFFGPAPVDTVKVLEVEALV